MVEKTKNIKFASWSGINKLAVKQMGKYAVYVGNGLAMLTQEDDAIWAFVMQKIKEMFGDDAVRSEWVSNLVEGGLFFFETEAEMDAFYSIFTAELTDSCAMYACTYDPTGECLTENT